MRRLLLRHSIETGFRQAELSTLTGEFDPPHIDRVPKTQSEIHCSGMSATEEYSIHGPEHQDLICSNSPRFEHCQNAASRFLWRCDCSHIWTLIRVTNKGRAAQLLVLLSFRTGEAGRGQLLLGSSRADHFTNPPYDSGSQFLFRLNYRNSLRLVVRP
jgi:hypothetical protein